MVPRTTFFYQTYSYTNTSCIIRLRFFEIDIFGDKNFVLIKIFYLIINLKKISNYQYP